LNAIRNSASLEYQNRVPAVTQGNIAGAVAALQQYPQLMNEFVDQLVNRIGDVIIKSRIWDNPLAKFKRGMMPYGSTIEEIYVGLLKAKAFDPNIDYDDVFKRNKPEIVANFHQINRQDRYDVTINEDLIKRAFLDDAGIQNLVSAILDQPYNSDYWDEYLIMKNLFTEMIVNDQFYRVAVQDLATATEADLKATVKLMRSYASKLTFMSDKYNPANVTTFTPADEVVVFIDPDFEAAMDVDVLATAFNMDKADYLRNRVLVDSFGVNGVQAIMADASLFVCADTNIQFTNQYNAKGLSWNYFLHHWGIYSMSRFCNAIVFIADTGTAAATPVVAVTGLTVAYDEAGTTFAAKDTDTRFIATVTGTVTPPTDGYEIPQSVVWSISGTKDGALADGTFIDEFGVLHVDAMETNRGVTIKAVTTFLDPSVDVDTATAETVTLNVGIDAAYPVA